MAAPKYTIDNRRISSLLEWIRSGEIAIPEIQRPFVWKASKVRDLMDSLLKGFPVGYLILWRNPTVKLKDGSHSAGKRILIDGQQRMTALMAALLGTEIVTKEYKRTHIRIAFHPIEQRFEVLNSIIRKDPVWIPDIRTIFEPSFDSYSFVNEYCRQHPLVDPSVINRNITDLQQIQNNQLGVVELEASLDIETVTKIFIRVNSAGVPLNQADFAMSKIAVNEKHGGTEMRKAIEYFCHLAVMPSFFPTLQKNDAKFARSDYFGKLSWMRHENDDLYDPKYTDMLRVAFSSEFRRGRMEDLVALLSGRNFETREYEEAIVEDTFTRLQNGIKNFINETHFKRFIMIIRSAGFIDSSLISSQNALNYAYILYLLLRDQEVDNAVIERFVRRWYVMSVLTGRYSNSPESTIDQDIRLTVENGIQRYADVVMGGELSDGFWEITLPQAMVSSSIISPAFHVFRAAQVKLRDNGFLSRDISVQDLITYKSDVHHLFPREYLKRHGLAKDQYNQIANYVIAQSEINIQIGKKEPAVYFSQLAEQTHGGDVYYGNITDPNELRVNMAMNCIPDGMERMTVADYADFLAARRSLMAQKIKTYFEGL